MLQNLSFATASNEIANEFLLDALIFYIIAINIYGFAIILIDKRLAIHKKRRISEKTLFIAAISGGAAGVWLSMFMNRHKTQKPKFRYGIPVILVLNLLVYYYLT